MCCCGCVLERVMIECVSVCVLLASERASDRSIDQLISLLTTEPAALSGSDVSELSGSALAAK